MSTIVLLDRLKAADPGWDIWSELVGLVRSIDFEFIKSEYMGNFYSCGRRMSFSDTRPNFVWPDWIPVYVPALYGMKADYWEHAGGYAGAFHNQPAQRGAIFGPAGNDETLGYPLLDVPPDLYRFQLNLHGATFFINKSLNILYPNSDGRCFEELDSLEGFTRKNIQQTLDGKPWFSAYRNLKGTLLD